MNDLLGLSNLEVSSITLYQFIIGFALTIIHSVILKWIYINNSNSVSNKNIIADIFPLFSISIFLIVITIKSSIVLSLGLVGALSIIRFRTAIKEAEQIVYFLILTGISIATAATSYVFPFILLFFIYTYTYYVKKSRKNLIYSTNDQLVISVKKISNKLIDQLAKELNENNVNVEIQSLNKKNEDIVLVFKLSDFDIDKLTIVEDFLKKSKINVNEIQYFSSTQ